MAQMFATKVEGKFVSTGETEMLAQTRACKLTGETDWAALKILGWSCVPVEIVERGSED